MKKILLFSILIGIYWFSVCSNSSFDSDGRLTKQNIEEVIDDQSIQQYPAPLQMIQKVIIYFNYSLVVVILLVILPIRRVFSRASQIDQFQLDQIDPVLLMLFYRKGDLQVKDFLTGVFALNRTGLLKTEMVKSQPRFEKDPTAPSQTIRFTFQSNIKEFKRSHDGRGSEIYLLKWLFKNSMKGMRSFTLSSIAGPTKEERKGKLSSKSYRLKFRQFSHSFQQWKEKVAQEYGTETWFHDLPLKWGLRLLVASLYMLILYIYIVEAKAWVTLLLASLILGSLALLALKKYRKKRYTVLYLIACIFIGSEIWDENVSSTYFMTVLLSYIFVAVVPRRTMCLETARYYEAIIKRRRVLKKGGYPINRDLPRLQRMTEQAIVLGVGKAFIRKYQQQFPSELLREIPMIFNEEAVEIIQYTNNTLRKLSNDSRSSSSSENGSSDASGDSSSWDGSGGSDSGDSGSGSDGGGGGGD